jgi:hypothetical protein
MALTITVGGNDITTYVDCRSIVIEEVGTELVATCSFNVRDHTGTVSIATKDAVTITDDGTTLFAGEVAEVMMGQEGVAKTWSVRCQDNNILLDERVVASESYSAGQADSAIINDLFTKHRSDINSTTYVATIDASMEAVAFEALTLRECMDDICRRTGGRYYVDYDKNLHYFTTENNPAGFSLSTSPDYSTSFPFGGFKKVESVTRLANKIYVLGKEVSGWVQDDDSITAYGERHAVSRDRRITTSQGVTNRGNAILDRYDLPRESYELHCWQDGLRAGMSVQVINETWGINSTFFIRKLRMEVIDTAGEQRRYTLQLNDEAPDPAKIARARDLQVATLEQAVVEVYDTTFDTDAPATPAFEVGNLTSGVTEDADGHQIVWVQATWGLVSDSDLDHYQIQISTSSDFSGYAITRNHPAGGDRIERFEGVLGNTVYYIRVRAVDWVGNESSWAGPLSITTAKDTTAPAQVTGLNAAASRTLIGLNWTANSEADLAHYEIQRHKEGESFATIAYAKLNFYIDQDFTDSEIANGDTFYYRVRAIDTSGNEGTWSAEVSATLTQIGTDHIAAASITTALLAAGAVTAEKISVSQLSAISADLGNIAAGAVTGATIRTAASGARVQLDSTEGIRCFNSSGIMTFQVNVDGSGQIGASDGDVPPLTWNADGQFNKIQANQLEIGQSFFTSADGLLLLDMQKIIKEGSTNYVIGSRGQRARLSGALHVEQGRWVGRQGIVIEVATTNLISNPSFEVDTTGWTLNQGGSGGAIAQDTSVSRYGVASLRVDKGTSWTQAYSGTVTVGDGETITASAWVYLDEIPATNTVSINIRDITNATTRASAYTNQAGWARLSCTWKNDTGSSVSVRVQLVMNTAATNSSAWFDGVQLEKKAYATSYCDGSLGDGYSWSGTAHASTSTRTVTVLTVPASGNLNVLSSQAGTIAIRFRLPYASGEAWTQWGRLFDYGNYTYPITQDMFACYFDEDGDTIKVEIRRASDSSNKNTGWRTVSYEEGEEILLVVAYDSTSLELYWNDTEIGSITSPNLFSTYNFNEFHIGAADASGNNMSNMICSEFATFNRKLSAAEVAQLYNLQRPLVDMGATDKPGIYILDGQFRLLSSQTGNRIEITPEGFKTIDSDDEECAVHNQDGFYIVDSESYEDIRSYKFVNSSGTLLSRLAGALDATDNYVMLRAESIASRASHNMLEALAPAGQQGRVRLYAGSGTSYGYFDLSINSSGGGTNYAMLVGPGLRISKSLYVGGVGTEADDDDIWCDGEISTDGGSTKWKLGGYSARAVTTTGYVSVWINGVQHKLVCKRM